MLETKAFSIGDVLSVTTGILVSHDHSTGVFNILEWMTGEILFHHQLTRAMDACAPVLLELYPQLKDIVPPTYLGNDVDAIFQWVDDQAENYGHWFEVPKLEEGVYLPLDPMFEFIQGVNPAETLLLPTDNPHVVAFKEKNR